MSESQQLLQTLGSRLSAAGFTIARQVACEPYLLDLVAAKREPFRGRHRIWSKAVLAIVIEAPSLETIVNFTSSAGKYVLDNHESLQLPSSDLSTIIVIVSDKFGDETKKWVMDNRPSGSSLRNRTDFPVLVALDERKLYYFSHTPFRSGLLYRMLRKFSDQYLSFVETSSSS